MDLQHSAMVIAVVAVTIQTVSGHELDNLKRTFGAVDVRELNVGFEILVEFRRMGEQAVGEDGRHRGKWIAAEMERGPWADGSVFTSGSGGSSSREFTARATR